MRTSGYGQCFLGVDSLLYFLSKIPFQRKMLLLFQETYLNQEKKETRSKSLNIQLLWYISSCLNALKYIYICSRPIWFCSKGWVLCRGMCLAGKRKIPGEHHGSLLFIMFLYSHFLYVFTHCPTAASVGLKTVQETVLSQKMFTVTGKGQ